MSESELSPPKSPWYKRIFAWRKLPGWASIGLGGVVEQHLSWRLFRIGEDIDFAISIARAIGGELGTMASVIASPFFGLGLIVYGILHLIFVGEPKHALRHQAWTFISWGVFGVCFTAIVVTVSWGGAEAYIEKQVTKRTPGARPSFWYVNAPQKVALAAAIDEVQEKDRFAIQVKCASDAPSRTFTYDLGQVFLDHKWSFSSDCLFSGLKPDFLGMAIAISDKYAGKNIDELPEPLHSRVILLAHILDKSDLSFELHVEKPVGESDLVLLIGNGHKT